MYHGIQLTRTVETLVRLDLRPAAVAALRIYNIQKDPNLLVFAERELQWMASNLCDPEDGLIWDSFVMESDGKRNMNKMKWTYNTGFAIHGFTLLYSITR